MSALAVKPCRNVAFHMDESLRKSAKIAAIRQGITLQDFLTKATEKYLSNEHQYATATAGEKE